MALTGASLVHVQHTLLFEATYPVEHFEAQFRHKGNPFTGFDMLLITMRASKGIKFRMFAPVTDKVGGHYILCTPAPSVTPICV